MTLPEYFQAIGIIFQFITLVTVIFLRYRNSENGEGNKRTSNSITAVSRITTNALTMRKLDLMLFPIWILFPKILPTLSCGIVGGYLPLTLNST